jgi:hypothetical protein
MANDRRASWNQIQGANNSTAGGGFAARRYYMADRIDRRSSLWTAFIEPEHRQWASYLGTDTIEELPKAERELVHLAVGDKLLVSLWNGSEGSVKEVRAAINNQVRIAMFLSERKREKRVPSLQEYLMQREHEIESQSIEAESTAQLDVDDTKAEEIVNRIEEEKQAVNR